MAAVGILTGCGGGSQAPAESVPALASTLRTVDSALADHQYERARRALAELVRTTVSARAAGKISAEEADRVLAAVARLVTALPQTTPSPSAPATSAPTSEPPAPKEENKDEEKQDEKDGGGGDGHNSDSGPDDGHGN